MTLSACEEAGRRAAPARAHPAAAAPDLGAARRRAPVREGAGALPGARRDPGAAPAARPARRDARRGRALARRELPLRPGAARLGEDVERRADGDRAHAGRPAGRDHGAQPQGDREVPGGRRGGRARAGLRVPRAEEGERGGRVRGAVRRELRHERGDARPGARSRGRHVVPLLARGAGRARGHALHRRGRAVRARRCARGRDGGAEPRAARRPEPARAGLAGLASRGRGRVGARAPARRGRDGAGRDGDLPGRDLADAARGQRVHLGVVLRGAARAGSGDVCAGGRGWRRRAVPRG